MKLAQMPVPEAALRDAEAVEMLRVWIAERGLHCSIKVGMYRDGTNVEEERAWGIILADIARHVAQALRKSYDTDEEYVLKFIKNSFMNELNEPTSKVSGDFVQLH